MCGIGGILRYDDQSPDRARLERMREALACRGPDAHGIHIDGICGLVHTRLAVIDPATGAQPMLSRNIAVVFNGEIYNHRELRRELEEYGHQFTTDHSDTEVLLHGFRQWGHDLTLHLSGMYAAAIWDGQECYLFRDPAGKKPLYGWHGEDEFVFGSTVAAVLAGLNREGRTPQIDRGALAHYLALGYTGEQTLLSGVREISRQGGMWMTRIDRSDATRPRRGRPPGTPATVEQFEQMLSVAVERRLEADVPLGCFLSGGIDSSLIAAMAQRKLSEHPRRGGRLRTFSVSMPDPRYDEAAWARRAAEHIGSEHTELRAEPQVEDDLLYLIRTMGEPIADSSILPTYWLSQATRQFVTVALSGDGGDELFGGYERYVALRLLRRHSWWLQRVPAGWFGGEQKSTSARLRRLIEAARAASLHQKYLSLVRLFSDEQIAGLGLEIGRDLGPPPPPGFNDAADPADAARFWDFQNYLPFDLLRKVDRASMAVTLEVRCPFLDRDLVDAALATPMARIMPGRQTKPMLRQIARRYLPAEIVARKKMGFAVPIGLWFRDPLRPLLQKWLLDSAALPDLGLNRVYVEQLIAEHVSGRTDHTHRLFALLTLAMWRHEFARN